MLQVNREELEADIYNHLLNFFSRYYDEGDFISKRFYKGDTYAIPYSGEEVTLPLLPGPFGDLKFFKLIFKLDTSPTAQKGSGFPAGSTPLRRFYGHELLEKLLLHDPLTASPRAPFTGLYECSEHYDTEWCKTYPRLGSGAKL